MHARSSLSGKSIFCSREGSPRYRRFFLMRFGTRKAWASIGFTLQQTASGSLRVGISLCRRGKLASMVSTCKSTECLKKRTNIAGCETRSEEHTSELQSRENLVCRLLLEKKKKKKKKEIKYIILC